MQIDFTPLPRLAGVTSPRNRWLGRAAQAKDAVVPSQVDAGFRYQSSQVAESNLELDPNDVIEFARSRLAGYKVSKTAELKSELPRNATGKVLKTELRKPFWEGEDRRIS